MSGLSLLAQAYWKLLSSFINTLNLTTKDTNFIYLWGGLGGIVRERGFIGSSSDLLPIFFSSLVQLKYHV